MTTMAMRKVLTQADLNNRAIYYLQMMGVNPNIDYHIKGNILSFKYNLETAKGMKTIERYVNLYNYAYKDKPIHYDSRIRVRYNICTGLFVTA